ncbi:hypothetical protein ACGFNU_37360 [Spirillospora sp. NPDC048911]
MATDPNGKQQHGNERAFWTIRTGLEILKAGAWIALQYIRTFTGFWSQ